ncbi:type IV pilus modification protein PilV [Parendozoicomonas sp. Alg238-R29]|uniref:type IV pilus modification protein PilV n=1 Tax=Parendozoicomonas sp. Alg238-R29 TaxID=2993446 RepID=UPI00248E1DB5|nr:type IV pilus modification protein PilV [Parendozoicomonas sp. Alg238-R29]
MKRKHATPASARGFSLVEILIALLILSVGILGMLALQAQSVKSNISSDQRTHALMILDSIEETILADTDNRGASICGAGALVPFTNNLSGVDNTAKLSMVDVNAPCPIVDPNNDMNIYRFQVSWEELQSFRGNGQDPTAVVREVRL